VACDIDRLLTTIPAAQHETAVARTVRSNRDKAYSYAKYLITTLRSDAAVDTDGNIGICLW
jgi:hypothetical protein